MSPPPLFFSPRSLLHTPTTTAKTKWNEEEEERYIMERQSGQKSFSHGVLFGQENEEASRVLTGKGSISLANNQGKSTSLTSSFAKAHHLGLFEV
mmetsp:Transcript_4800/g.14322  ORF Transcript_4800/g.14322 Transcript_4800/m.14322 type:complete len:95 (-) Transcript_4800:11-295(-)